MIIITVGIQTVKFLATQFSLRCRYSSQHLRLLLL